MASEAKIKPWQLPLQNKYIFLHATIIDPADGSTRKADVTTKNGIIAKIADSAMRPGISSSDTIVIDLEGRYLCPGLIDSHVHLMAVPGFTDLSKAFGNPFAVSAFRQPYVCSQMLARGFTSVRDCGGATLALKEAIADGVFPGPRLFIAGHALSQTGGHADIRGPDDLTQCCGGAHGDLGALCDGVGECMKAAREQIRTGADFIKIMGGGGVSTPTDRLEWVQFSPQEIRAIVTIAENCDTYATAHAYTPKAIRHAIDNGVRGIEHGNFIDEATAQYMAKKNIFLTPTLVTYAEMGSPEWPGFLPPESAVKNEAVLQAGLEGLKIASTAGVTICYGTDLLGPLGAAQTREFSLRSQVLSSLEILQSATVNPARMLRQENRLGQIKEGYMADLLVLNASPVDDVTILDRPDQHLLVVMKEGRIYESRWSKVKVDTPKAVPPIE